MLAIIPARGGSKGLPGKNIKILGGKPLIAYTIEAALRSKNISRVILSTDDKEIAQIGMNYGAEVPFLRPSELATDSAKSIDTYLYTLKRIAKEEGNIYNEFVVLQPTSPFRTVSDIDNAIELFKRKNADSVVSYCEEHHPISWHKYIDKDGKLISIFEDKIKNRQEERSTYFPNGAIFIFKKELLDAGTYYSKESYAYLMARKTSVDIDTIDDFEYAEFLLKNRI